MIDESPTNDVGDRAADDMARAVAMLSRRASGYLAQWEQMAAKLRRSDYHADDLVEDCFRLWGNSLRDAWAVTAVMSRAAGVPRRGQTRPR